MGKSEVELIEREGKPLKAPKMWCKTWLERKPASQWANAGQIYFEFAVNAKKILH